MKPRVRWYPQAQCWMAEVPDGRCWFSTDLLTAFGFAALWWYE